MVHSAAGVPLPPGGLVRRAPFRAPHHTSSVVALVGGGSSALRPGEISLAHGGVLFLDELGEFPVGVLDALRQPLEDGCHPRGPRQRARRAAGPVPPRRRHQPVPVRWWATGRVRVRRSGDVIGTSAASRVRCSTGSTCGSPSSVPTSTSCSPARAANHRRWSRPASTARDASPRSGAACSTPICRGRSSTRSRRSRRDAGRLLRDELERAASHGSRLPPDPSRRSHARRSRSGSAGVGRRRPRPARTLDAFAGAGLVPRREGGVTDVSRRRVRRSPGRVPGDDPRRLRFLLDHLAPRQAFEVAAARRHRRRSWPVCSLTSCVPGGGKAPLSDRRRNAGSAVSMPESTS